MPGCGSEIAHQAALRLEFRFEDAPDSAIKLRKTNQQFAGRSERRRMK